MGGQPSSYPSPQPLQERRVLGQRFGQCLRLLEDMVYDPKPRDRRHQSSRGHGGQLPSVTTAVHDWG